MNSASLDFLVIGNIFSIIEKVCRNYQKRLGLLKILNKGYAMIKSTVTISLVPEIKNGPFIFTDGLESGCVAAVTS